MVRAAALALLFAQQETAPAEQWPGDVYVGVDAGGSAWLIRNADFDKRTKEGMTGWVIVDHAKDRTTRARRSMLQVSIVCGERKFVIYQTIVYGPRGEVMSHSRDPYASLHTDQMVPGSIGDMVIAEVCDKN